MGCSDNANELFGLSLWGVRDYPNELFALWEQVVQIGGTKQRLHVLSLKAEYLLYSKINRFILFVSHLIVTLIFNRSSFRSVIKINSYLFCLSLT